MKTNESYHADREYLSSSILKLVLTDVNEFYERWVLQLPQPDKPQFQEGSLTHALILEPHEVEGRYAFYQGLRRVGADFEAFKAANEGKEILLASTKMKADRHVLAVKNLPKALELLQNCTYEHTMLSEIMGVKVKARADAINVEQGYIIDVKTSSLPTDKDFFKQTVNDFYYHLSAALYCSIASNVYNKNFDFYWIVISKADNQCAIYKMSSETSRLGTSYMTKAIIDYRKFKETNSIDSLRNTAYTKKQDTYEILEV